MGTTMGLLIKGFTAEAAIARRKVCKFGAADGGADVGAGATELLLGLSAPDVDVAVGETVDVHMHGIAEGIAGGTVSAGDRVTSDANGDLVATTTANDRVLGIAMESAVDNDIFNVWLTPGNY